MLLAESKDFVNWEKKGIVIRPGPDAEDWDSGGVGFAAAAWIDEEVWLPLFGQDKLAQVSRCNSRYGSTTKMLLNLTVGYTCPAFSCGPCQGAPPEAL